MFLELKPKGMYLSSEKEKENGFLVYRSTKREARTFDVLVMQSNEQKCLQNCCFSFQTGVWLSPSSLLWKHPDNGTTNTCVIFIGNSPPSPRSEYRRSSLLPVRSSVVPGKKISVTMKNSGFIQKKYWQHFRMMLFIFQHEDTTRKFVSLRQIALKLSDATKTAQKMASVNGP